MDVLGSFSPSKLLYNISFVTIYTTLHNFLREMMLFRPKASISLHKTKISPFNAYQLHPDTCSYCWSYKLTIIFISSWWYLSINESALCSHKWHFLNNTRLTPSEGGEPGAFLSSILIETLGALSPVCQAMDLSSLPLFLKKKSFVPIASAPVPKTNVYKLN